MFNIQKKWTALHFWSMENYRNQFCMKTKMMFPLMETAVTKSGKNNNINLKLSNRNN